MGTEVTNPVAAFIEEARKAGAQVHQAPGPEEACVCLIKLAKEHKVKVAVKSKSQIADNIKLRQRLEKEGISVVETDLSDGLSQLLGDKVAGKMTIGYVQQLISGATGQKLEADPQVLLDAANTFFKQNCMEADLGISEAMLGIAETGSLVVAGDEGVTRLTAVLPRIHVTLLESQNIVPVMEDVLTEVRKRNPSLASQAMPAYITYITGRNTTADIPGAVLARAQGPAEEHIIVIAGAGEEAVA